MKKTSIALFALLNVAAFQAQAEIRFDSTDGKQQIFAFPVELKNATTLEKAKQLILERLPQVQADSKLLILSLNRKDPVTDANWGDVRNRIIKEGDNFRLYVRVLPATGQKSAQY